MMTDSEFEQWCQRLELSSQARQEIERIRGSEPSRRTAGGRKSVSGRYPSSKMGFTIQFESHKVELRYIYILEHDEEVLEFYDQPPPFKINYKSQSGRNVGCFITPDYFVIRTNGFEWVECKTEDKLKQLAEKIPNRYVKTEDNQWRSPPAEEYTNGLGGRFHLWSDEKINWKLQRNLEFLEDYYRGDNISVSESVTQLIKALVSAQPSITLSHLIDNAKGIKTNDIYYLIAQKVIYIDLENCLLTETDNCRIFPDINSAFAYKTLLSSQRGLNNISYDLITLTPNTCILYDGKPLTINFIGETNLLLKAEDGETVEFSQSNFDNLVRQGKIVGLSSPTDKEISSKVMGIYTQASEKDLKEANKRYRNIQPYLKGKCIPPDIPQRRSLYVWLDKYRQAEQQCGYGYIGLISLDQKKGNCRRKLPQALIELIRKFIDEDYETNKQKSKQAVYNDFVAYCFKEGLTSEQIPSYKTFIGEIKKGSGYEQTLKREGHRAAYAKESFYWELKQTTPRHGDFPFHICHIDHTELDIELRCSKTNKTLGRPWLTLLMDAYSRRILAAYITFDFPSYRSCMMVLRICVQRYGRLPQTIVADNGKEFHSIYFETLLAMFECTLKHRPATKSRFSGVCERLFGTTNTEFIYNLAGNTQITKKVRLMTKSVNPKNLCLWTLGLFYLYLNEFAYLVYDTIEHPALEGQSPREAFNWGISSYGTRDHRRIAYDDTFRILTLPTTYRGRAKVQPSKGVKIFYKYYWSTAFRDPEIEKTLVNIRYEPFNAGIAYAYVRGQWVQCISEYYPQFQGRSEKEVELATAKLNQIKRNHGKNSKIRAKQLGEFLSSVEGEETLLQQRLRDEQAQEVFRVIEGRLPNLPSSSQSQKGFEVKCVETHEDTEEINTNPEIKASNLRIFKTY